MPVYAMETDFATVLYQSLLHLCPNSRPLYFVAFLHAHWLIRVSILSDCLSFASGTREQAPDCQLRHS